MKRLFFKTIIALAMFLLLSAGATFIMGIISTFINDKVWQPLPFEKCIEVIMAGGKPFQMWLMLELAAVAVAVYIFFSQGADYYKAKQYKVTDTISIPVPAGQGQHGTAWFASPAEIHKRYSKIKVSKKIPLVKKLLESGEQRRGKVKQYIKNQKRKKMSVTEEKVLKSEKEKVAKEKGIRPIRPKSKIRTKYEDISYRLSGLALFRLVRKIKEKIARRNIGKAEAAATEKTTELALCKQGGIVIDETDEKTFYCITNDQHTLINGSTNSGKTRSLVLPSLCTLALAGESIIATDAKGEINAYTSEFLKNMGYKVTVLNFTDTSLSNKYNLLQPVINAVNEDDISQAITRAWDLTTFLVEKNEKTEPIWRNGEMSVIAAAILCVVYDNKDNPQFQNMTNVYHFISEMFREIPKKSGKGTFKPIDRYLEDCPTDHPARGLLGISAVAPDKTAGSFYTSALTTLQLFTSPEVFGITNSSDLDPQNLGKEKNALFFVLPENKSTYYPIVTLICSQIYDILTETAKANGNRLKKRVNFLLDEFGNFSKIADFVNMLTVGRGYGIRFNMFIQSFAQIKEKYGDNALTTIQDNCIGIYLSGGAEETNKAWEKRLGTYTTTSYSLGGGIQHRSSYQSSSNVNLTSRELLKSDEIAKIKNPYVLSAENQQRPAVTKLYDISKLIFNDFLGLGSREHNESLIAMTAQNGAPKSTEVVLWKIWEQYNIP